MSLLTVKDLSQSFIDKTLYEDANFVLNKEDHMGVTGQNGVGKSTLIKILTGEILPDDGQVTWQNKIDVGYLDQYAKLAPGVTIRGFLRTAFDHLFQEEKELNDLYAKYAENGDEALLEKAGKDRKSTRLNSSHVAISYAVFCLKKKITKLSTYCA